MPQPVQTAATPRTTSRTPSVHTPTPPGTIGTTVHKGNHDIEALRDFFSGPVGGHLCPADAPCGFDFSAATHASRFLRRLQSGLDSPSCRWIQRFRPHYLVSASHFPNPRAGVTRQRHVYFTHPRFAAQHHNSLSAMRRTRTPTALPGPHGAMPPNSTSPGLAPLQKPAEVDRSRSQQVSLRWDDENTIARRAARLQFEVAECVETKTVTTTTTTKRSYPPLLVREPRSLQALDSKEYPLASRPTPPELRRVTLDMADFDAERWSFDSEPSTMQVCFVSSSLIFLPYLLSSTAGSTRP